MTRQQRWQKKHESMSCAALLWATKNILRLSNLNIGGFSLLQKLKRFFYQVEKFVWSPLNLVQWLRGPNFPLFWPPPTYSGQTWTFHVPPTFCPRRQFQKISLIFTKKNPSTSYLLKSSQLIGFTRLSMYFKKSQRQWFLPQQLVCDMD